MVANCKNKKYTLDVVNITLAPDGTERMVFAVNGQFPGPTIEAGQYPDHC